MTVTDIRKDPASRTMTLEAEFDASQERVWQLWGAIRDNSSAGGDRRPTQRRSMLMTCAPAARSITT